MRTVQRVRLAKAVFLAGLCCALVLTVHAAVQCVIDFVSHGAFNVVSTAEGTCLQFVDDLGTPWEITNPRGSWKDGLSGTVIADSAVASECSQDIGAPLRVCQFDADESRTIVGIFDVNQFVSCPGFVIRTQNTVFRIVNCDEIGPELCDVANVGKRVKAGVFVDASVTNCIDPGATVLDFRFLQR